MKSDISFTWNGKDEPILPSVVKELSYHDKALIKGDNLDVMHSLMENYKGKINLIYIDPPFMVGKDFKNKDGELAYSDKWSSVDEFLCFMYERLKLMHELLADDGSIYVHCDWRFSGVLRLVLGEVFGEENFRNEVIWYYEKWTTKSNNFQKNHDTIFYYSKNPYYIYNLIKEITDNLEKKYKKGYSLGGGNGSQGLIVYDPNNPRVKKLIETGKYKISYANQNGKPISDVWSIPFINPVSKERLSFPTQKPEALLERIIKASSNEGDLVADFFCGSGTTAAVAEKLGRKWIATDASDLAIETTYNRLKDKDNAEFEYQEITGKDGESFFDKESVKKIAKELAGDDT